MEILGWQLLGLLCCAVSLGRGAPTAGQVAACPSGPARPGQGAQAECGVSKVATEAVSQEAEGHWRLVATVVVLGWAGRWQV